MKAAQEKSGALAKLAALFCDQPQFREFLGAKWHDDTPYDTSAKAADLVRKVCEVSTRAEFDIDPAAADRFHDRIRIPYVNWQLGRSA